MIHDKDKYRQSKGIKPKNRVWCPDCRRPKMKFETEKEAKSFIKWNHDNFDEKIPSRIYWCEDCCGYHITAKPDGGVGIAVNITLPYLTDALETDRHRVMGAVKMLHNVLKTLKQPSGYYGKSGLGKCRSILDALNNSNNPYYLEEREKLSDIVDQMRERYKPVWMKRKYCRLIKTKLYRALCDLDDTDEAIVKEYNYQLTYILYLARQDKYDINELPELFLDEWEAMFQASPASKYFKDKMTPNKTSDNGADEDNQNEENLHEGEEYVSGIQVGNQSKGL